LFIYSFSHLFLLWSATAYSKLLAYFLSPQSDTSLHYQTPYTEIVHRAVYVSVYSRRDDQAEVAIII